MADPAPVHSPAPAPAARAVDPRPWTLEDPAGGPLTIRLPAELTREVAEGATAAVAVALLRRNAPTGVVVDLLDVAHLDMAAPLVAVRGISPVLPHVARLELAVQAPLVRAAAVSAARLLGIPFSLRDAR